VAGGECLIHTKCVSKEVITLAGKLAPLVQAHELVMARGTALALQIGHRISVDLDFFTSKAFSTDQILKELTQRDLKPEILQETEGSITAICDGIKVSIFHYPYPFQDEQALWEGIPLSGIVDIASMKVIAISQRGAKRDFVDLYYILKDVPFRKIARNMVNRFSPERINPVSIGKGLTYFNDAEADPEPVYMDKKYQSWNEIEKFFRNNVRQIVLDMDIAIKRE